MFKKQLEDLSLKNQPLMDKFVTLKPKLERVALPTPTHRNPFDDPGVRRESVKKPPKPPSPERSKSASVRSRSAPVHKSMTYLQKLAICRMDEQHLRARVITWAIEKYGSGNSTIRKVLDQGASYYQKLVNLGHGNECRQVEGTCYAAGMAIADEELRVLHADNCGITKAMVLEKLRVAMTPNLPIPQIMPGAAALEDRYHFFMRHYGWGWRRYTRCSRLAPKDLQAKITNWARTLCAMHAAREYKYAVCCDETSVLEEKIGFVRRAYCW